MEQLWLPGLECDIPTPAPPRKRRLVAAAATVVAMVEDTLEEALRPTTQQTAEPPPEDALPVVVAPRKPREKKVKPPKAVWPTLTPADFEAVVGPGKGEMARADANIEAIKTLQAIRSEGRTATPEERAILVRYSGWGSMPWAFNTTACESGMRNRAEVLKALLPEDAWKQARESTPNAHYTSIEVVEAIWRAIRAAGFKGGRVLEPSAGVGHFIGGMPADLARESDITAVELDGTTADICRALYEPFGVRVVTGGYEDQSFEDGFFDLVVSNVPFGNYRVAETRHVPYRNWSIHNYFIARSVDAVRDGGLVVVITSSYTLDSGTEAVRRYMASKASLELAVRLPSQAFKASAGTEVTTDVLVLRKRAVREPGEAEWTKTAAIKEHPKLSAGWSSLLERAEVNVYYHDNPERLLGSIVGNRLARGGLSAALSWMKADDGWLDGLREACEAVRSGAYTPRRSLDDEAEERIVARKALVERARPGYAIEGSEVVFVKNGTAQPLPEKGKRAERVRALIRVRDAARKLVDAQPSESVSDDEVEALRRDLNVAYDAFFGAFGRIRERANRQAFADDAELPLLLSLEEIGEGDVIRKASIMERRTVHPAGAASVDASDPASALAASLQSFGRLDPAFMAQALDRDEDDLMREMETCGMAFLDPLSQEWETADAYLSGDIEQKLRIARNAGDRFERNVAALSAILPPRLTASEVSVRLGASWIPADVFDAFIAEHFCN